MKTRQRRFWLLLVLVLFVAQGLVSSAMFPAWKKNYSAGNYGIAPGLSADQLLASISGLRQMVAGILWVRSDEYFHSGQFDAILPVVRLVTWLNPKQLEVYSTGAWHIGYNFTDEQNRSDRRYIPLSLRLLADGVQANPDTYLLYHDTGWMYYHKVDEPYDKAVFWFEKSVRQPDVLPALKSILATAYQRAGRLDDALNWYAQLLDQTEKRLAKTPDDIEIRIRRDTVEKNLDNLLVRMTSRGIFGRKAGVYDKFDYDTHNPVDLNFTVKVTPIESKVIRVTGTWGIPTTGARVRMVLRDADYNLVWQPAQSLDFERDRTRTFMLDSLYTQSGRFDRKVDMSRNPTMYPFRSKEYFLEFYFNPRSSPPHIQDKLGWNGEGMTDKRYLATKPDDTSNRILFAQFRVSRDFLLKRGAQAPLRSPGYQEAPVREESDVIIKRSLRN